MPTDHHDQPDHPSRGRSPDRRAGVVIALAVAALTALVILVVALASPASGALSAPTGG